MNPNLWQLLYALESSLPVHQVLHSLLAQAMRVPEVRELGTMVRTRDLMGAHLQSLIAATGFIRRMLNGDRTQGVLEGLQRELGVVVRTHQDIRAAFTQLMTTPAARQLEALQAMSQVMGLAQQAFQAQEPLLRTLVASEVFTGAK